jgi:hypothetical protein
MSAVKKTLSYIHVSPEIHITVGARDTWRVIGYDFEEESGYTEILRAMDSPSGCFVQCEIKFGKLSAQALLFVPRAKYFLFDGVKPSEFKPLFRKDSEADKITFETSAHTLFDPENVLMGSIVKTRSIDNGVVSVAMAYEANAVVKAVTRPEDGSLIRYELA